MIHHSKGLEKFSPMMIFSKASTETPPLKNPETIKENPKLSIPIKKI